MLQRFEAGLIPANEAQTIDLIAGLMRHYWLPDQGTEGVMGQLQDWATVLHPYPVEAIQAACKDWLRYQKRRPSPADMLELLETIDERPFVIERLRRALAIPIAETPEPQPIVKGELTGSLAEYGKMRAFSKAQGIDWPDTDQKSYLFGSVVPVWWQEHLDQVNTTPKGEASPQDATQTFYNHNEQARLDWLRHVGPVTPAVLTTASQGE